MIFGSYDRGPSNYAPYGYNFETIDSLFIIALIFFIVLPVFCCGVICCFLFWYKLKRRNEGRPPTGGYVPGVLSPVHLDQEKSKAWNPITTTMVSNASRLHSSSNSATTPILYIIGLIIFILLIIGCCAAVFWAFLMAWSKSENTQTQAYTQEIVEDFVPAYMNKEMRSYKSA